MYLILFNSLTLCKTRWSNEGGIVVGFCKAPVDYVKFCNLWYLCIFQVKSLPSSEMLIGCVREWRKRNKQEIVSEERRR